MTYGERIDKMVIDYKAMNKEQIHIGCGVTSSFAEAYITRLKLDKWAIEEALRQIAALDNCAVHDLPTPCKFCGLEEAEAGL